MAISDDELFDDIEFDDDAFAQIDAQTTQFLTQAPAPAVARVHSRDSGPSRAPPLALPPPKRRRTPTGWVSTTNDMEDEDLPDITITGDGSYALAPPVNRSHNAPVRPVPNVRTTSNHAASTRASMQPTLPPIAHSPPIQAPAPAPAPAPVPVPVRAPAPVTIPAITIAQPAVPQNPAPAQSRMGAGGPPRLGMRQRVFLPTGVAQPATTANAAPAGRSKPSRTLSAIQAALAADPPAPSQAMPPTQASQSTQRSISRTLSQVQAVLADPQWTGQSMAKSSDTSGLAELQRKLAEAKKANDDMLKKLKEAENAKFAKEGEVSLLRRNIDKTAQEHAAALATLRQAKQAAEAAQEQGQRSYKEELERIRTQYMFKKHEMETSTRKPSGSVMRRQRGLEPPPTPVPLPSQMRGWNDVKAGPNRVPEDNPSSSQPRHMRTPTRPRVGLQNRDSPRRRRDASTLPGPAAVPKGVDGALPGFVNAFNPSPTRRSSRKGKQAEMKQPAPLPALDMTSSWNRSANKPSRTNRHERAPSPPSSPTPAAIGQGEVSLVPDAQDERMSSPELGVDAMDLDPDGDLTPAAFNGNAEELSTLVQELHLEPASWKDELAHVIFSHISLSSNVLAIQEVMTAVIPSSEEVSLMARYTSASDALLRRLGQVGLLSEWPVVSQDIARSFLTMLDVLCTTAQLHPMTALVDLWGALCFCLPDFAAASWHKSCEEGSRTFIAILKDVITKHLQVAEELAEDDKRRHRSLTHAVFFLLEGLLWNISDLLSKRFSSLLARVDCFESLVAAGQPSWLIHRTARLLALTATRTHLAKQILTPRRSEPNEAQVLTKVVIELCHRIIDRKRRDEDARMMRQSICAFLATLAIAYDGSHAALLQSPIVVLSLVHHLHYVSAPLFEEDPSLVASSTLASSVFEETGNTLFLLYHLIMRQPSQADGNEPARTSPRYIKDCLDHPPDTRALDGVDHLFHVALSRLSFAEPPDFLSDDQKIDHRYMQDIAKELLDCVMDHEDSQEILGVLTGWDTGSQIDAVDDIFDEEEEMAQEVEFV